MSPEREESTRRETGPDIAKLHAPILRERAEPRDGYEPVPFWLIGLFGVLLFWGGWYLAEFSGGFRADVLDPRPEARFPGRAAAAVPPDPVALGRKLFTANCVSCHQQGGQGVPGQYPPLAGSEWVVGAPARLKRILLHGLSGEVVVKGATYDGNMAAFGARLTDERIAAVLTFLRQEWGNDAEPIPPESVAATREATRERRQPWSAGELLAVDQPDYVAPPEPEKKPAEKADK
jgi:mono/diheme cytochrome c family protein